MNRDHAVSEKAIIEAQTLLYHQKQLEEQVAVVRDKLGAITKHLDISESEVCDQALASMSLNVFLYKGNLLTDN